MNRERHLDPPDTMSDEEERLRNELRESIVKAGDLLIFAEGSGGMYQIQDELELALIITGKIQDILRGEPTKLSKG